MASRWLLGGDEFGRTQGGNNNAYCQDNEISWYDWKLLDEHADLFRFVCRLIQFRKEHAVLRAERFYNEQEVVWLGPQCRAPDWHGPLNQVGCVVLDGSERLALLFNAAAETCEFLLPPPKVAWKTLIDTASESPQDAPDDRAQWTYIMKSAISRNGSLFNSHRMMRRYAAEAYL